MKLKSCFTNSGAYVPLFVLVALFLAGYVVASLLIIVVAMVCGVSVTALNDNVAMLLSVQFLSSVCTMLLPAIGTAWLCSTETKKFLFASTNGTYQSIKPYIQAIAAWILISPTINLTAELNNMLTLPDFLAPIEAWMKAQEESMANVTDLMLKGNWLACLFVIAFTAGVTEEFFFRGALLNIFKRLSRNKHVAIWTAAIIFSAVHLQFYGFIPRMLLGAFFGYLVCWTGNIWIAVFTHFCNNASTLFFMKTDSDIADFLVSDGNFQTDELLWMAIIALATLPFFFYVTRIIKKDAHSPEKE